MKTNISEREQKVKVVEKEINKAKNEMTKAKTQFTTFKQQNNELFLEISSLKQELIALQAQLVEARKSVKIAIEEEEKHANIVANIKKAYDDVETRLKEKKSKLANCDKDLNEINTKINDFSKTKTESELELKKIEHKITRIHKDKKDAAKTVDDLLRNYDWISTEKQYFGVSGTAYDFQNKDATTIKRRLNDLQITQEKLSKRVNMKALSMFEKAEKEYNDLLTKKKIVEQDKAKIEEAIRELDDKKNEALKKAYEQVTRDFGSIFSSLLPGATAKLIECEGMSILDGLQIKVAFGNVWKENLSELSGGQRSLVALSLVLSLLLFKPAPLYILDEVDSALDLSHTQNIGQMLRTHFKQSQFIVVSLKDGMFTNANVLFKTDFVDGISVVKRTAQLQPSIDDATHGKENTAGKTKKALASSSASSTTTTAKGAIRTLNM